MGGQVAELGLVAGWPWLWGSCSIVLQPGPQQKGEWEPGQEEGREVLTS